MGYVKVIEGPQSKDLYEGPYFGPYRLWSSWNNGIVGLAVQRLGVKLGDGFRALHVRLGV